MSIVTQPVKKQAALAKALRAKIVAMNDTERDERVREIYNSPDTPENSLEFVKLMFGEDMSIGEVEGAATIET